jgi:hypothetical protein
MGEDKEVRRGQKKAINNKNCPFIKRKLIIFYQISERDLFYLTAHLIKILNF